jgi:thiamine biosynthesis protein ThiS
VSIRLIVNGQERQAREGTTIASLLETLQVARARVAVEHNHHILKREEFDRAVLREGDRIEIVHFVGGG